MTLIRLFKSVVCAAAAASAVAVSAAPTFSNSAVVTSATNIATFNSLNDNFIDLATYQEGGINVTVPNFTYVGFQAFNNGVTTGFHYGNGGDSNWVNISLVGGGAINALDFLLGDGFGGSTTNLIWETFSGTTSTGFGNVTLNKGSTVGWTDTVGFTRLRVAAAEDIESFGQFQAIALDDVRVGAAALAVPEPGTLALVSLSLLGIVVSRRKA